MVCVVDGDVISGEKEKDDTEREGYENGNEGAHYQQSRHCCERWMPSATPPPPLQDFEFVIGPAGIKARSLLCCIDRI